MYHRLSDCILRGEKLATRSLGCFYLDGHGCGLGRALLATGWPDEIPANYDAVESQWPWLAKSSDIATFGTHLSKMFEMVYWGHMTIEEYTRQAREWEELHDEALCSAELQAV